MCQLDSKGYENSLALVNNQSLLIGTIGTVDIYEMYFDDSLFMNRNNEIVIEMSNVSNLIKMISKNFILPQSN